MRILIMNWRDWTHPWAGGAEVFLLELAKRWTAAGHSVTWYSGRHPTQSPAERLGGIDTIRRGGFYGVFFAAPVCYQRHLAGRFDVILDSANGLPFFTPLYSTLPKVALVHHIHDQVFFRELTRPQALLAGWLERVLTPLVYRRTPFITVSESSRRALIDLGVSSDQVSLVYNGVDLDRYRPGDKSEAPLVLFLGRLRHYKSVDTAIRALPHLVGTYPDLRFSIAGSGPAEGALRALAVELGVVDRIRFHGHVSEGKKLALLQQAHVVVNPSMKEGWGLTVLEANACGTPVVGADVPGLRDSICNGVTGLLVPHGEPALLAQAVGSLLHDPARRDHMAQEALAWARRFNWDDSALRGLDLLRHAANGHNP
jgi:glycosyltransferase involved in cell wall biosynthesis